MRAVVPPGFHEGELAVQRLAGVSTEAAHLRPMLDPAELGHGAQMFLQSQRFAVLSGRDDAGRLWISPLTGPAGFLEVTSATTLRVHRGPAAADPLYALPADQSIGLLVIDLARRRRFRINGWLRSADPEELCVEADQAYGNCPQYIQQRELTQSAAALETFGSPEEPTADGLQRADEDLITAADTFFLGTTHPTRGSDASHRGGPAGFVRVEDSRHLWWPDYPGNNMFNSIGNLAVDPTAALLFYDFATGRTLHLSGRAELAQTAVGAAGDDGRTGRRVRFTVDVVAAGPSGALRGDHVSAYQRNPPLTGR
jgi:hypothetical protein